MIRRFSFLAALALVVSFATGAQAQSSFAGISTSGNPVSYTSTGGALPVTLSAMTTGNTFTVSPAFLASVGPEVYANATFELFATSNTSAQSFGPVLFQENFSGYFEIKSNGTNLLSSTFTNAILSGPNGGAATFQVRNESYTSDILLPIFDTTFSFTFANAGLSLSNGVFQNFNSGLGGDFSAQVIPEPATLAMAGLGIFALPLAVRVARRRRAN